MNIILQDIIAPFAELAKIFKKIIFMNGDVFYAHDNVQNEYHEIVLLTLEEKRIQNNSWKKISSKTDNKNNYSTKIILEHITKSRNILCITADALSVLHHSSYTLNENSEIISITSEMRFNIINKILTYAAEGNSVIGIAIKKIESKSSNTRDFHNGIFIAIVLREYILLSNASTTAYEYKNSKETIKIFSKELLPTCKWFARKIGVPALGDFCITSDLLESMSDTELALHMHHTTIFAEMRPLDFVRVSRLLTAEDYANIN